MDNLMYYEDNLCNPMEYKIKEEKLMPDFLYTKELIKIKHLPQFSYDSLKMDLLQLVLVDNDCLKMKIFKNNNGVSWDIEGKLWETSELFQMVLKEKELNIDRYVRLNNPKAINEVDIPKRFKIKQREFDKTIRSKEKEFFVFEAYQSPDPILVMQLNRNPDRNFLLGVWD